MSKELSANERIKGTSNFLRGTLAEGVANSVTGSISADDQQLVKFHGMYLQDDRDMRAERMKKKMEPAYAFMIRIRLPGGICTPKQWLALDRIARDYGNGTLRLTTRQTFQLHGVIKSNLKDTLKAIDSVLLDTICACGDVNRNVLNGSNPTQLELHQPAQDLARAIATHLLPRTKAWREIWVDGEKVIGGETEEAEPIYGKTYLPRKFKIVLTIPPSNDVDVFAHDLGFIAILDKNNHIEGWNITVGGGMGMTHGEPETYPRTADVLGFCRTEDAIAFAEAIMTVQRDWGDRSNRKHARFKYTVEDRGLDNIRAETERRVGKKLGEARPFTFTSTGDRYGWTDAGNGNSHLTMFVQNGRLGNPPQGPQWLDGMARIAEIHDGEFRCTANQNVIIANVSPTKRNAIEELVAEYGLTSSASALRRNSMACVALPTCALALAESERYLPDLVTALEAQLESHGLANEEIVIRMTGCPNGCARPYLAEIGLVGKGPGRYNLYLGAAFDGTRMSKLYAEDLEHDGILHTLNPLFAAYAADRQDGERFSAFLIRIGHIAATGNGPDFHANVGPQQPIDLRKKLLANN